MDDRTTALFADASVTRAEAEYRWLREALRAHVTGDGFVAELVLASQQNPRAFTRAVNDPGTHLRAAELGVEVPTYTTLPLPGSGR